MDNKTPAMKTLTLNIDTYLKTSKKDWAFNPIRKGVILIFLIVITNICSLGQTPVELNTLLEQMTGSGDSVLVEEANHIKSLVTNLHPTVFIGDVVRASGESDPVRADVKAGAISKLNMENPLFGQVEMITLRINTQADLSALLDLSAIQGFTNLKYVRLLCSFACAAEQLDKIVTGNANGIKVFYSISIPS
jgi:hypothetical protein